SLDSQVQTAPKGRRVSDAATRRDPGPARVVLGAGPWASEEPSADRCQALRRQWILANVCRRAIVLELGTPQPRGLSISLRFSRYSSLRRGTSDRRRVPGPACADHPSPLGDSSRSGGSRVTDRPVPAIRWRSLWHRGSSGAQCPSLGGYVTTRAPRTRAPAPEAR